jgi:hypothetical protein
MPKTLKALLCLSAVDVTVLCATGIGLMVHQETQAVAAEQTLAVREQAERGTGAAQDMAAGLPRSADFEACARGVRDDYSDDPVKAYWWIRTICQ